MAKTNESKALEVKVDAPLPVVMNFEEDAGAGLNNLTAQDYAIPFMSILQQLSPQLKRGSGIDGAVVGAIFNTVTKEVIDGEEGITVIPCFYQKSWIEWKTRESGGGFVKQHPTDELMATTFLDVKGNAILQNGNVLVPTANYYILVVRDNGAVETAVLSMTKTQLTESKKWNSIIGAIKLQGKNGMYTPPMFSHMYHLTTHEKTKNSFSWYGWEISNRGPVNTASIYALAKKLNNEAEKGALKVKHQEDDAAPSMGSEVM